MKVIEMQRGSKTLYKALTISTDLIYKKTEIEQWKWTVNSELN